MCKMEVLVSEADSSQELRKKRRTFLQTILKLLKSRAITLNGICESLNSGVVVPEHYQTYEMLREQIRSLRNDITLLISLKDSINLIHNSITSMGLSNSSDPHIRSQVQKTVSELSFFSRSVMKLYEESITDVDVIKKKQEYSLALEDYQKNLDLLKERQKETSQTAEETRILERAEARVNKINFIRIMKAILIGKFARNSEQYESLQQYRTSFRRNLTVDDFKETWDVGLK